MKRVKEGDQMKSIEEIKFKLNQSLVLGLFILSILALSNELKHPIYAALSIVGICFALWFFVQQSKAESIDIHTPAGYLAFYFGVLGIVFVTGKIDSFLFPEGFIFATLFTSINAGRKVSTGVSIMSSLTIVFLILHYKGYFEPNTTIRVLVTCLILLILPQVMGFFYRRRLGAMEQSRYYNVD